MSQLSRSPEKPIQIYNGWVLLGDIEQIKNRFPGLSTFEVSGSNRGPVVVQVNQLDEDLLSQYLLSHVDSPLVFWWGGDALEVSNRNLINRWHPDFLFFGTECKDEDREKRQWIEIASLSLKRKLREEQRSQLVQQYRLQEELATHLEALVTERTEHLQSAKLLEDTQVQNIQRFIRFVQDLAESISIEQIVQRLRLDLRQSFEVNDVFLIEDSEPFKLHRLVGADLVSETISLSSALDRHGIHFHDVELQKLMAEKFGRPFAKTTLIPIHFLNHRSYDRGPQEFTWLVIESTVKEELLTDLVDYCLERLEPFRSSLDRVLIEMELENSAQLWETSFTHFTDALAMIDRNFNVLIGNKAYYSLGSQQTKKCFQHLAGRDQPCIGCPILNHSVGVMTSLNFNNKNFELTSAKLTMGGLGEGYFIHRYRDITEERLMAARMIQTEKWGALGKLSNHVAHELNNPLTGIKMSIQMMQQNFKSEITKSQFFDDLVEVEKAATRSLSLIAGLRNFVSGETKMTLFSLDEVIQGTIPLLKTAMRSIRLDIELSQTNKIVWGNPHLFGQVVFNLIHNSTQALKNTVKPTIKINTQERSDDVILWVADNGPGIPSELESKIFEPFFTTKKADEGTGIGLSLCRQIVTKFGGEIGFLRPSEGGASFWVRFPRQDLQ